MTKPLVTKQDMHRILMEQAVEDINSGEREMDPIAFMRGAITIRGIYEPELAKLTAERDELREKLGWAVEALDRYKRFYIGEEMLAKDALAKIRGTE